MWLPLIAILSFLLIYVIFKKVKSDKDKILKAIKERGENKKEEKKASRVWTIVTLLIFALAGYGGYKYFTGLPSHQQAPAVTQQQWQLCWEKKPEYEGKTPQRDRCLSAKIESRNESHIIISYSYSGGRGIQEGTSTDGKNYDGEWRDSTGWGKWHLKFVSSDTAFGWSDDGGKDEKQPSVFERKT